ncbi:MAG: SRPBCC family protein [Bacteroidetes bacterium]|nr:SRPBCC family protein [Bacteroidota bacterium]
MSEEKSVTITVETVVSASPETVWQSWTDPAHIINWNFASGDWCCPSASVDLRPGGAFSARMEARDGSFGFDFGGVYETVSPCRELSYVLDDGRKVVIRFSDGPDGTVVTEQFEAENINSADLQKQGWQAILNQFKKYTESLT